MKFNVIAADIFVLALQLASTVDYGCADEITPIIQDAPLDLDFSTTDAVTLASLREEDPVPSCSPVVELPAPITPSRVGEELIRTCVTPRKVTRVQEALDREKERHKCALKLLPYFFTKEEVANSNTNGTHQKACLDSSKLNSLKTLVFSKFPASSNEEKDKIWRSIKGKINTKYRASKFACIRLA